jgi:aldehyde:ferredoxin oxidoreductase
MAGGYVGKYCVINLSDQSTKEVELGDDFYRKYLAGYGLGAAVVTELQAPGIDPLSPEAHLGFCSGLLNGTGSSFAGRFMIVGKSPLTGGWGDANSGGFLAQEIKKCGYDAVFFTGVSKDPVWVQITDEGIKFNDATSLWGKDNVETNQAIKEKAGVKKTQVASIGIAGEKLSLISGVTTDDGRIAARSGLGAVMGSKKLKAVSFLGNGEIPLANPQAVKDVTKQFQKDFKKSKGADRFTVKIMGGLSKLIARTGISAPSTSSTVREIFKKYGTPGLTVFSGMTGDTPVKNWDGVGYTDFKYENMQKISGDAVIDRQKKKYSCRNCPLACGGIVDIKKGRYQGTEGHKPEYETWGAFGTLLLHSDLDVITECNEMCNRAGIDTISTGGTVAFAIECFENGLINEETTGGLKLGWGRSEEIVKLTEMIINREGFGDVLADGVRKAAENIGKGSEQYAVHAGGQELPMHDSKLDPGFAIAYQCEPTPGRHTIASYLYGSLFSVDKIFPIAKKRIKQTKGKEEKNVQIYAATTTMMQVMNGCGLCEFGPMTALLPMIDYINAVTGWDLSADEYFEIGERILSLRKAFNVREGIKPEDTRLHDRAIGKVPLKQGPLKGVTIDIDNLQAQFFNTVGWDTATGGPTEAKMKELGIDQLFA